MLFQKLLLTRRKHYERLFWGDFRTLRNGIDSESKQPSPIFRKFMDIGQCDFAKFCNQLLRNSFSNSSHRHVTGALSKEQKLILDASMFDGICAAKIVENQRTLVSVASDEYSI